MSINPRERLPLLASVIDKLVCTVSSSPNFIVRGEEDHPLRVNFVQEDPEAPPFPDEPAIAERKHVYIRVQWTGDRRNPYARVAIEAHKVGNIPVNRTVYTNDQGVAVFDHISSGEWNFKMGNHYQPEDKEEDQPEK
jgi:hypothetical protein|tara:strand:+ start:12820 stop:13230 length:411 start_codon:yes stop_codon:yes gene_type:complete